MFELIQSTTALFNTGWPLTTISDDPNNSGNRAGAWQYGDNFGGGHVGGYRTSHGGGIGAYGAMGVSDDYPIALEGGESAWIGAAGGSAIHPLGCWAGRDKIDNSVC